MLIKAPFSYYGGKSKLVHLYPAPTHDLLIEPFGGSGAYAWHHRNAVKQVWINDCDSRTFSIWKFLTHRDAAELVSRYVPDVVEPGTKVSELIPGDLPGLAELCRAEANQGTQGAKGVHDQVTKMGAKCWKVKRKALEVIPAVKDWHITNYDYNDIINLTATWFVDPPYSGPAGARYRTSSLDYDKLGWWCVQRKGQVIVCENLGADWLDFQPIPHKQNSIRSRYQKANAQEVMWTNSASVFTAKAVESSSEKGMGCSDVPSVNGITSLSTGGTETRTETSSPLTETASPLADNS